MINNIMESLEPIIQEDKIQGFIFQSEDRNFSTSLIFV